MEKLIRVLIVAGCCMFYALQPLLVSAQTEEKIYRIEMKDGNYFLGTIVSETDSLIVFNTPTLGQITILRINVKNIEEVNTERIKDGEFWFENPHATRYLFSTNGLGLKKGEAYYQNTWVFFNNVNVGLTDNFSIGVGTIPMFLFGGAATPIWILPKASYSLPNSDMNFSVGGMFGGFIDTGDGESGGFGLAYGTVGFGDRDNNITFGLGYGYANGDWAEQGFFNIAGMLRVSKTGYLITENYFIPDNSDIYPLFSVAYRWAPENIAADFGLLMDLNSGDFLGIPWLGVSIPFGK